jgi:SAM-dependent methyltransferase
MSSSAKACGNCGARSPRLFVASDLNRHITGERFPYYRCSKCGLVFLDPVPDDLGRYYPRGYHEFPSSPDDLLARREHEDFKLEAIGSAGQGKRLLEIGPSYGGFIWLAKQAGYDAHAIEMDPDCARFLRGDLGIPTEQTADIPAALGRSGTFDVITLWHSIEHFPDPWAVLDAIPDAVRPGGLVAIASPNPWSVQFRTFGKYWVHLDAPRHVYLIPPTVLEQRLAARGFKRVHFSTKDRGSVDCNHFGWLASPKLAFPAWMHRQPFIALGLRIRGRLIPIERREPYGSSYTMVFQRA